MSPPLVHEQTNNLDKESNDSTPHVQPQGTRVDTGGDLEMTDNLVTQNRTAAAAQNQYVMPFSEMPRAQAMSEFNHLSGFESSGSPSEGAAHFSTSSNTNQGATPVLQGAYNLHSTGRRDQSGSPSHRSEKADFQDIFSELTTGSEHENAFLSRHYAEVIGPWYGIVELRACPSTNAYLG